MSLTFLKGYNVTAVIHTYTIIRTPPQGFEGAPYCVAIVDIDGRLETARISGYSDGQEISIGDQVDQLLEPDEFGTTFKFK